MSVPPQQPPGPGQPGGPSPYGPPPGGGQPYGSPYPGQPYPGQQPPPGFTPRQAPGPVEKPKEVETAFRLGLLSIVLSIVSAALTFTMLPAIVDATLASGQLPPGTSADQVRQFVVIGLVFGGVVTLVLVGLYLLFLFKMRAGRSWARILVTILGALWIAMGLWGLVAGGGQPSEGAMAIVTVALSILQWVVIVAGIFFMFRPAAGPYFQQERDY